MTGKEFRQGLIEKLQRGQIAAQVTKEEFGLAFPDAETLYRFLECNRLYLHINPADLGEVFTLSRKDREPWAD